MADKKRLCMQCMLELDERDSICPYCGYAASSKQEKTYLPLGITVRGRYSVGKMIKRNVDSAVYIGRDIQLEKTVEIREFFPTGISERENDMISVAAGGDYGEMFEEYRNSFIHLWKNLMRFKGLPALLDVVDVFEENNTAYAVTDHNDSTTFRKILDTMNIESNPFSLERTRTMIMSVFSTVESLHTANVVHRGISPETLVLSSDGTLKITGFAIPQVRTTGNRFLSSVCDGYAAIEQYDFNWQQGSWTDIYSIGALLYKMLTGRTLPPAPERLKDENLFFTAEERQRIPDNIIKLMKNCLVLMPQERIKDVRDVVYAFSPDEASKKTVTAKMSKIVLNETEDTAKIADLPKTDGKGNGERTKEIVKPKQAQPQTRTSQPKVVIISEEHGMRERKHLEVVKKPSVSDTHESKTGKDDAQKSGAAKQIKHRMNPVALAFVIGLFVSVGCVLATFILYGTVLYRFLDAPVLDNCLSYVSFLPINHQEDEESDIKYVSVADFRTLTREYIENDALYNKKYNIVFEYDYCDTVEKGYVFSQSIESGNEVPVGSTITVYISKGIEMIPFINVSGKQFDEAQKLLSDLGFSVIKEEIYNIGIYTQDKVISSSLSAGEEYPKGTEVTLKVWGAPPVTLPSTSESEAQTTQYSENESHDIRIRNGDWFSFFEDMFGF